MSASRVPERASYGFGTTLDMPFDDAVEAVTSALKTEGFGVLTRIDVRQTMRDKLDVEIAPYVILGACNPSLAYRGIQAEPELGLLLPCNVIVRQVDGQSIVSIVDPAQMLGVVGELDELQSVATDAATALRRVLLALEGQRSSEDRANP